MPPCALLRSPMSSTADDRAPQYVISSNGQSIRRSLLDLDCFGVIAMFQLDIGFVMSQRRLSVYSFSNHGSTYGTFALVMRTMFRLAALVGTSHCLNSG